jgi:hypothetical protein
VTADDDRSFNDGIFTLAAAIAALVVSHDWLHLIPDA